MKPMACFCEVFERGAVMSEIKGLFEKVKIENLMAFLYTALTRKARA